MARSEFLCANYPSSLRSTYSVLRTRGTRSTPYLEKASKSNASDLCYKICCLFGEKEGFRHHLVHGMLVDDGASLAVPHLTVP